MHDTGVDMMMVSYNGVTLHMTDMILRFAIPIV